jgi:hypothetical protein
MACPSVASLLCSLSSSFATNHRRVHTRTIASSFSLIASLPFLTSSDVLTLDLFAALSIWQPGRSPGHPTDWMNPHRTQPREGDTSITGGGGGGFCLRRWQGGVRLDIATMGPRLCLWESTLAPLRLDGWDWLSLSLSLTRWYPPVQCMYVWIRGNGDAIDWWWKE